MPLCNFEGCTKNASFNYEGETKGLYCSQHKLENMLDVKSKRCNLEGCNKQPIFNYEGETKGLYCNTHKLPNMIDIKNKRCNHCNTIAYYGYPNQGKSHCAKHKQEGQNNNPNKRCEVKNCNELAIYNNTEKTPKRCEEHKLEDDLNLIEKQCVMCGLIEVLNKDNLCTYCDPEHFKGFRLGKQLEIKSMLDVNNYNYKSYDSALLNKECDLKSRPDFVFDCVSHYVILEVDEYAHGNNNELCECSRMVNISQSLTLPTIFIRYNPDKYYEILKNKSKVEKDPSKTERQKLLRIWLDYSLSLDMTRIKEIGYCSMIQLYYNNFNKNRVEFVTITSYE